MVDRIRPPHVEFAVEQRTTEITPSKPMFLPVIVGPAYYQLRATQSDGSPNPDALVHFRAMLLSGYGPFSGLENSAFYVEYQKWYIEFPSSISDPSAEWVANYINQKFSESDCQHTAKVVNDGIGDRVAIISGSPSAGLSLQPPPSGVTDAIEILGFSPSYEYACEQYKGYRVRTILDNLPDPDGKLDSISLIDEDLHFYIRTSNGLLELSRTEAFYRYETRFHLTGTQDISTYTYPDDLIDRTVTMTLWPGETTRTTTLLQGVRQGIIDLLNELVEDYENHRADTPNTYHATTDNTNGVQAFHPLTAASTLSQILSLVNDLKKWYNYHDNNDEDGLASYHSTGGTHQVSTSDATDWASTVTLVNDIRTTYTAHIGDAGIHSAADSDNTVSAVAATTGGPSDIVSDLSADWPELTITLASGNRIDIWGESKLRTGTDGAEPDLFGTEAGKAKGPATIDGYFTNAESDWLWVVTDPTIELPLTTTPTQPAQMVGTVDLTTLTWTMPGHSLHGKIFQGVIDGRWIACWIDGNEITSPSELVDFLSRFVGPGVFSIDSNRLVATSAYLGLDSVLYWSVSSSGCDVVGWPKGVTVMGMPLAVQIGDEVWSDGEKLGTVVNLTPAVVTLDRTYPQGTVFNNVYFRAKNLDGYTWGRPIPELTIEGDIVTVKHNFMVDNQGKPILDFQILDPFVDTSVDYPIYVSWRGVRTDLGCDQDNPTIRVFETQEEIEEELGEPSLDNPLALGAYLAKQGAQNSSIAVMGISDVTDAEPQGTTTAYQQAFECLKDWEVHSIVPLTYDFSVVKYLLEHVQACRDKEVDMPRIGITSIVRPTHDVDTAVLSGTKGETLSTTVFDTRRYELGSALREYDLDPTSLSVDDGVYLTIADNSGRWSISSVDVYGRVTVRNSFAAGENDDGYYTTEDLPSVFQAQFSIMKRGAEISTKYEQAVAYQNYGKAVAGPMIVVAPDHLTMNLNGIPTSVPAYYAAAYLAGLDAELHPNTPMSKWEMAPFIGAEGAFPYFSKDQLDIIAGGGIMILWQPDPHTPSVKIRHQLMTDTSSVKTREWSVIRQIDFGRMFLTNVLKPHAGRHNINAPGFSLESLVDAGIKYLIDSKVWRGAKVISIQPSDVYEDRVEIKLEVELYIPGNVFSVTLYI